MRLARVICGIGAGRDRGTNGTDLFLSFSFSFSARGGVSRVYTTRWYISMCRIFPELADINLLFLSSWDCYYFLIKRYCSVARPHPREQMMWNEELTRRYAPCSPLSPSCPLSLHSSFYLRLYRNDPFVLLVDSRSINRVQDLVGRSTFKPVNVFFEIDEVRFTVNH